MWYLYIIYSPSFDKFYVGISNDVVKRLLAHNNGKSSFTKRGIPWELKYSESFIDKYAAAAREKEIKMKKSRLYIEALVK